MPQRVLGQGDRLDAPRFLSARPRRLGERFLGPPLENVRLRQEARGRGMIRRDLEHLLEGAPAAIELPHSVREEADPHDAVVGQRFELDAPLHGAQRLGRDGPSWKRVRAWAP